MRKLFTLITSLLFFIIAIGQPKKPLKIEIFRQSEANSMEFTSNRFSAINVSKDGVVWAGTIYQGLYRYDTKSTNPNNSWKKSTVAPNLFINDIKPDGLGGIWVAQSGNNNPGGSHIQGGVNHIPDAKRDSVVFYSITGTQTEGYFYSRNLVSLCITDNNRKTPESEPESLVFAAQAASRMSGGGDLIRGGLNMYTIGSDKFERIAGSHHVASEQFPFERSGWDWRRRNPENPTPLANPFAECVGGSSKSEIWVAVRDNYDMTEIVRYYPDGRPKGKIASYNHTNSTLSQYSQPRAIHFDDAGNRWITTRYDGVMVFQKGHWTQMKLRTPGLLPSGAVFNRNAIAEDEWGNVYFGTDAGLMVYKVIGAGSKPWGPTNDLSYELYTTTDGLPGNNITGVAYDKINGKILITVDGGGVAFVNVKPDHIEGLVFDVYTDIFKKNAIPSNFETIPISNAATAKLFHNGEELESVTPDDKGYFQFSKEKPGETHSVEVEFTNKDGEKMKYNYTDIKSRSKVPLSYFPDSLIRELKKFKDSIETKHMEYKILSIIPVTTKFKGFYLQDYDAPYAQFWDPAGIDKDHAKKVYNLGIYLANLKTVYDLGDNATVLAIEGMDNVWAAAKVFKGMLDLKSKLVDMGKEGYKPTSDQKAEAQIKMLLLCISTLKDGIKMMFDLSSNLLALSPEIRPLAKAMYEKIDGATDFFIEIIDKRVTRLFGEKKDIAEAVFDVFAKVVTTEIGGGAYSNFYARGIHRQFVPLASAGSVQSKSDLNYAEANWALVSPVTESLLKKGKESLDDHKQIVADLHTLAKASDRIDQFSMLVVTLGSFPLTTPLAAAAVAVAKTAKITQLGALATAMAVDVFGVLSQTNQSSKILDRSGINGLEASIERKGKSDYRRDPVPPSQKQPVKLLESKNKYNEKLSDFQAILATSNFTEEDYLIKINELMEADSVYIRETKIAFENLIASVDSAIVYIPDFDVRLDFMMDSFVNRQADYKVALFLQQYAVIIDLANKVDYLPGFDSTANELKILNDSIYNNFVRIIDLINENNIGAPAYLSHTDYVIDHEFGPGTPGSFTNTYTNYGTEAMRNVSFKINEPTEQFSITSADSIYIGNIAPGASVQISFNFNSPLSTDSITIGRYEIDIKADNGKFSNTSGSLMIIKRGALPVTLINFEVNCSGANSELSWETTSESNSSHFEVEKSMNGIDWVVVRRVTTAGNSSIRRLYKMLDQSTENSFYRLKHVDLDGKYTYSNVLRSKCGAERPMISVYPVPATNVVNVLAIATKASIAKVILLDITGREVRRLSAALQSGTNTIRLNTSGLPSGQYILKIDGTEINKSMKITISK